MGIKGRQCHRSPDWRVPPEQETQDRAPCYAYGVQRFLRTRVQIRKRGAGDIYKNAGLEEKITYNEGRN